MEKTNKVTISSYQATDGTTLSYRYWAGRPGRPVLVQLHGIEGHSEWLEPTANILNDEGMTIYAPDRRGSGLNKENRGHFTSNKQLLSDVQEMLYIASKEDGPLFLVGNCWGAKPAVVLISQWQQGKVELPNISGLILTSPALVTKADLTFPQKIKVAFEWIFGIKSPIAIPLTPEMLTDNKPYLDYIISDPNRLTEATAAFFAQTFFLTETAKRQASKISLPLLVMQAGRDDIVDTAAIEKWFSQASSTDKTYKNFSWMAHSLDFDVKADEYLDLLINWINQHS
ncbi:MAG: lysophospholipase [Candidatus Obscuribacterales bacterium]|nr:lysophospholipase [Candidatus Obscuribacterales bacterium]